MRNFILDNNSQNYLKIKKRKPFFNKISEQTLSERYQILLNIFKNSSNRVYICKNNKIKNYQDLL